VLLVLFLDRYHNLFYNLIHLSYSYAEGLPPTSEIQAPPKEKEEKEENIGKRKGSWLTIILIGGSISIILIILIIKWYGGYGSVGSDDLTFTLDPSKLNPRALRVLMRLYESAEDAIQELEGAELTPEEAARLNDAYAITSSLREVLPLHGGWK
jgi:hypothetical protein